MSSNVHEARLVERVETAAQIDRYVFATDGVPLVFRPGQFVSIRVGNDESGALVLRSYSLASRPGAPHFELVLKRVPGGMGSQYLFTLAPRHRIHLTGPMGFFVCELAHAGDVVFGATGVGIAPVLPMLHEVLAREETGRVHLLWGSRHERELFWLSELESLRSAHARFSYRLFVSALVETAVDAERGRISAPLLELAPTLEQPTFYLVGSGAMVKEVKSGLVALGFDRKRQIRNEVFFD